MTDASHGPSIDGQAQLGRGNSELARRRRDSQIARRRQLRPGTERRSVDGRDRRGGQTSETAKDFEKSVGELTEFDTAEIGPAAERWWRARQHDDPSGRR